MNKPATANLGERLQLLLNLTSRITSSLDLREVVRAVTTYSGTPYVDAPLIGKAQIRLPCPPSPSTVPACRRLP